MVEYCCSICNFKTNIKTHYTRHLQTKKHKTNEKAVKKNLPQFTSNSLNLPQFTSLNLSKNPKIKTNPELSHTRCNYCNLEISSKNMARHQRTTCKKIPNYKQKQLIEKYNSHKSSKCKQLVIINKNNNGDDLNPNSNKNTNTNTNSNNTNIINTNSNNTTNIQNNNSINVNINPFGEENIEKITEKQILKILNKAYSGFPQIIKHLHFNIEENRNVYQPNINKPYIKYYNGNRWLSDKFDSISQKMFNKVSNLLEDWLEEYQTKINERKQNVLNNFIDDCNDGKTEENFNNELKMFFMDYSNEIKEHITTQIKESDLLELID